MRIEQLKISDSVKFFKDKLQDKYNLKEFTDPGRPVVLYGMYKQEDFDLYLTVRSVVVWCGTDAKILNKQRADIIKSRPSIQYAKSEDIHNSLKKFGIRSIRLAISPTKADIEPQPLGRNVYAYIGNKSPGMVRKYKVDLLKRIETIIPYKIIYANHNQYNREDLLAIYRKCFIGIRLLDHDGLSNSIIEMGLMGRKTISNGGLPYTIKWKKGGDIKDSISRERKLSSGCAVSDEYKKLLNISNKWLEI